jgi:glycerophosphoryl diester phosphodiesterase
LDRGQEAGDARYRRAEELTRPLVIAHRGAAAVEPENSLAAFRAARALGADAVELDVHVTADGVPVVHHDPAIRGLRISAAAAAAVRGCRLRNGEPVPTLDEALAVILPGMLALVEVKALPASADAALLAAFDRSPAPDRIAVHAFDHRLVRRLARQRSGLQAGVITVSVPVDPVAVTRSAGATVLWQHEQLLDAELVGTVHGAGLRLFVWTDQEPLDVVRLLALGVDGICTDHPDQCRRAVDSLP